MRRLDRRLERAEDEAMAVARMAPDEVPMAGLMSGQTAGQLVVVLRGEIEEMQVRMRELLSASDDEDDDQ